MTPDRTENAAPDRMTMSNPSHRSLNTRQVLAYAAPAFAFAMPTLPVYIYLPSFYADTLGLGLAATGAIMLVARCFDALTDPIAGLLSDRTNSRLGPRKPWIVAGAILAAIGLLLVVNPPENPGSAYLLASMILLYTGWTAVMVPYTAWAAELSTDYDERARITLFREAFGLVGILIAALIPVALSSVAGEAGKGDGAGLQAVAVAAIAAGAFAIWVMVRATPHHSVAQTAPNFRFDLLAKLRRLGANKPFLRLGAGWFINGLANGIPAVLFLLYLDYGLGADETIRGLFILVYFLCAVLSMPLWGRISAMIGKHRAWCLAMIFASLAFVTVPLIPEGGFTAFLVVCIITGAALGADLSLPPALQADVIDYHRLRSPTGDAGLFFAAWNLITKFALALAAGIGLYGVEVLGFDPKIPDETGRQALIFLYALVPVGLKVCATMLLWNFPIGRNRQIAIVRRIRRRNAGVAIKSPQFGGATP